MNDSTHTPQRVQYSTDYYLAMEAEIQHYRNLGSNRNAGLGIDLSGGHQPGLTELLQGIASYEQAVGKAFLASQRVKSAKDSYDSSFYPREAYASPHELSSDHSGSPTSSPELLQNPFQPAPSCYFSPEMPLWRPLHRPAHVRSNTAPEISRLNAPTSVPWSAEDIEGLMSLPDFPESNVAVEPRLSIGTELAHGRSDSSISQDSSSVSDINELSCSPATPDFPDEFSSSVAIAGGQELLNTGTPRQDVERSSTSTGKRPRSWTIMEDDRLRTEVRNQQAAGVAPLQWTKIGNLLGDRNGVQCQARWAEVLDENIRKGRWSCAEDDMLKQYHHQFGSQWSKIAEHLQTRTQRQCRSRWLQIAGSSVKRT